MALSKRQKSLKRWTKQKWGYVTKGDEKKPRAKRGRYLPKKVRESLSKSERAATNKRKRAASRAGRQRAKYTRRMAKRVRRA